jgi:hypothetical protein
MPKHNVYSWKSRGIIIQEGMLEKYENTTQCELCNIEFDKKNFKTLDHCHLSGYNRFVCCNRCNLNLVSRDKNLCFLLLEIHRFFNRLE